MPGVVVSTVSRQGGTALETPASGRYFAAGLFSRGPVVPTVVESLSDFYATYGARPTYSLAYDDLVTYFRNGGGEAVIRRVVGAGATTGTLSLLDSSSTASVRVDATSPGAWSSSVKVAVTAGAIDDTVSVSIYLDSGDGDELVSRYNNLGTVADLVDALNRSRLVKGTVVGANLPAPRSATALSAGNDQRASVNAATLVASLDSFTAEFGTGVVAIPGYDASLVAGGLLQHCIDNGRTSYVHLPLGTTYEDALAAPDDLVSNTGQYQKLVHPWVQIAGTGSTPLTVPPTGYAAAMRAVAHRAIGPWRVPAGEIAAATALTGLEQQFTQAEANSLNDAQVSVIRQFGAVIELYGDIPLATDLATYPYLARQDSNNVVAQDLEALLQPIVFSTIDSDGLLFQTIRSRVIGYLEPIRAAGGLYGLTDDEGTQIDPGYQVVVDSSNNTAATLARNEVHVSVGLRWSPVAEMIYLDITSVGLTTAF
jgi:hypothetical protein